MLTARTDRKERIEDIPPVPQTPTRFLPTAICPDTNSSSFSVNETQSLNYVNEAGPAPAEPRELTVSGVSFMDLSDTSSESETNQVSHCPFQSSERGK